MSITSIFNQPIINKATIISRLFVFIAFLLSFTVSAQQGHFNFNAPERRMELDSQLREISGISFFNKPTSLLAIQDEAGIVYEISTRNGQVLSQHVFHPKGDFEDIQYAPPYIFVNKSKGEIYQLEEASFKTNKTFESGLNKLNDIEGMFYQKNDNSLLLACKGPKDEQVPSQNERSIYKYDLSTNKLSAKPLFTISKDDIENFIAAHPNIEDYLDLNANYNKNEIKFTFGPSAVAIDPKTEEIYLVSSVGKVLVILSKDFKIQNIVKLKKHIYPQPEGLAFDQDGNLYISSEGKKGNGALIFLKRQN